MRIVNKFGEAIINLVDIEPYTHFLEGYGQRSPITRVIYSENSITIEWGAPLEVVMEQGAPIEE